MHVSARASERGVEGSLYHTNAINQMCAFKLHCELRETEILTSADMNISLFASVLKAACFPACLHVSPLPACLFTPVSKPVWHVLTRRFIIPPAIGAIHP